MSRYAAFCNRLLSTGNTFEDGQALLHKLVGLNVHEIGAWQTMLGDEDRLFVPLDIRKEFGGLALERGDEFGTHGVTLQYHFRVRKRLVQGPDAGIKPRREAGSA